MGDNSKIEWTDATWNVTRGCSRVSAGCEHCYAERIAHRFSGPEQPYEGLTVLGRDGPRWNGKIMLVPEHLADPLRWKKPRRVFVNSMSDLFHPGVPFEYIAAVFGVMAASPQHTFQVLTKRPERMREWLRWAESLPNASGDSWRDGAPVAGYLGEYALRETGGRVNLWLKIELPPWPLPNVWLGVSCEDQAAADERIPLLLQCPAAVRFVSAEPLIGLIGAWWDTITPEGPFNWLTGAVKTGFGAGVRPDGAARISWIIVGGESGPGARPMHPDWTRSIRDACNAAGVPFFFKQWGAWEPVEQSTRMLASGTPEHVWEDGAIAHRVGKKAAGRELDGRTYDEFPEVAHGVH